MVMREFKKVMKSLGALSQEYDEGMEFPKISLFMLFLNLLKRH
jgi:hypothetical protein